MELLVESREEGVWTIVDVGGEVDLSTAPRVREKVAGVLQSGRRKIVLNLAGVTFMDSSGLGMLVGVLKRVRENDGDLALAGVTRPVMRVLTITGLDKVFRMHDSVAEAVE